MTGLAFLLFVFFAWGPKAKILFNSKQIQYGGCFKKIVVKDHNANVCGLFFLWRNDNNFLIIKIYDDMKKTKKTILFMAIVAALMFLAASCGATEDEMYTAKDFLFIKVNIDRTWFGFGILCMYLAAYWIGRFLCMRDIREDYPSISYLEAEDYIMGYADSEWDKAKAENNIVGEIFWLGVRCGPFFCRVTPVMMVYSWFFDFVHLPYWMFTILTCLALRFVPRWLGVDLSRFYNKWIVIWSVFSLLVFITALIVNK